MVITKTVKLSFIIAILFAFSIATVISVFTYSKKEGYSTIEKIADHKHITINRLKSLYNADEFNCNKTKFASKVILFDSTLIGYNKQNNSFFIKAKVNTNCDKKYFLKLDCSKKIYEQVIKTKSNHLILVTKVYSVENKNYELNLAFIDRNDKLYINENNYLVTGECLNFAEMKF